jgi:glutamate racemase
VQPVDVCDGTGLAHRATIGVFDSGVGGLSVWQEIARQMPGVDLVYLADQAHCPYGSRAAQEIREFSRAIAAFLITQGADVVVVACNTASAAALSSLRSQFAIPIVGMEPAIKPAAARTQSGHVGVIATQVTFQGELFASLLERFAGGIVVHTQVCPGLVERVEEGRLDDEGTLALLHHFLDPLLAAGVDTIVLGCTHYAFLRPAIERVVGPGVAVIDPAPAVARQAVRVLLTVSAAVQCGHGQRVLYTAGDLRAWAQGLERLGVGPAAGADPPRLAAVRWRDGLTLA